MRILIISLWIFSGAENRKQELQFQLQRRSQEHRNQGMTGQTLNDRQRKVDIKEMCKTAI